MGPDLSASERIWYEDLKGFAEPGKLWEFLPMPGMSFVQQLNAIMRLSIYYAVVVVLLLRRNVRFALAAPIVAALATYGLFTTERMTGAKENDLMERLEVAKDPVSGELCTVPTRNNPFMNVLMSDYARFPERPRACSIDNAAVKRRAEQLYDHNLYRDSDDIYHGKTASRMFHTTPSTTIPNDQGSFASWLYQTQKTCKEGDGQMCALHIHRRQA